jgi:hypothetical protein
MGEPFLDFGCFRFDKTSNRNRFSKECIIFVIITKGKVYGAELGQLEVKSEASFVDFTISIFLK